jgi:hypothetical protein
VKRSERSPYSRLATDADKQTWSEYVSPKLFVGFVQVTESDITHWGAVIRTLGIRNKHTLHRLCDHLHLMKKATPGVEVSCMTCIVRIENGPHRIR